jgi:AraC family transcriptional regulator, transcriptional activator FtrA
MHTVAAIAYENISPFELAVAAEVFGVDRPELGVEWYRFMVVAACRTPIMTESGFSIDTKYTLRDLRHADTIIIPSWDPVEAPLPEPLARELRAAFARGARLMSFCTGAFALAWAGLLDGRRATTHWRFAERFQAQFPEVMLDPGVLYVDDGQVLTSAGTAAGIDLSLYVVRQDHGADVANMLARRMVVPPHRDGGQAQFVAQPLAPRNDPEPVAATLDWMLANIHQELPVEKMAERAHMSPRTFARRFRQATGTTPHKWLLRQRVQAAQRLLETTDEPVELVAERTGFASAAMLRIHFQKVVRTSPLAYRRCFNCDEPVGDENVA